MPNSFLQDNHFSASLLRTKAYIEREHNGIKTGLASLDRQLEGLSNFVVVQGDTAACKSTFLWQIGLYNAVQCGNPLYVYDQENGERRSIMRGLSNLYGISITKLQNKLRTGIEGVHKRLVNYPIWYFNQMKTIDKLEQELKLIMDQYPDRTTILLIDSLQGLIGDIKEARISIDTWLIGLEKLKLKYGDRLCILASSEKNRDSYGVASKKGSKESGRIEYKAEQLFDLREGQDNTIILQCLKNRDGVSRFNIHLRKTLADASDDRSFNFRLEEIKTL